MNVNKQVYIHYDMLKLKYVTQLTIFREKLLDVRPKSICAIEMTMYVHWRCMNINRKDVHA